jgi:cholesterol transport system auxiliary component
LLLTACALTSKSTPVEIEYFTPELGSARVTAESNTASRVRLRLGHVAAADHLRSAIVYRTSPIELSMYHSRRWTERPDDYVRRALERELFGDASMQQAVASPSLTLDVDVLAFEEVTMPERAGSVELAYRLRDQKTVIASGKVSARRRAPGTDFAPVVTAIGGALDEATTKLAEAVRSTALRKVKLLPANR